MSEIFGELSAGLLADGYGIRFQARGTSMLPLIESNETIIVEPVETRKIRRGDILLYRNRKGVTAHRVVRIEGFKGRVSQLFLKGDSCATPDEPITPREVMGRVCAVERAGRRVKISGRRARARWRLGQYKRGVRDLLAMACIVILGRGHD